MTLVCKATFKRDFSQRVFFDGQQGNCFFNPYLPDIFTEGAVKVFWKTPGQVDRVDI